MINKTVWDGLSENQRMIIRDAAAAARDWERGYCRDLDAKLLQKLKEQGMSITEPPRKAWEEVVAPIYTEFEHTIGKKGIQSLIEAQK